MNIGIITGASSGMGKEFVKLTMQNMGNCQAKRTLRSMAEPL